MKELSYYITRLGILPYIYFECIIIILIWFTRHVNCIYLWEFDKIQKCVKNTRNIINKTEIITLPLHFKTGFQIKSFSADHMVIAQTRCPIS